MLSRKPSRVSLRLPLIGYISLPARPEFVKNFKADGSIETRSFSIDNETDRNGTKDDYRGETNSRLMVGGSFDVLDDVHGRFLLDNSPEFGTGPGSIETQEAAVKFDNAYAKIDKLFGDVGLTVGQ